MIANTRKNGSGPESEGPIHALFYIRVSTDKQAQKKDGSLDTQMDLLNKLVELKTSTGESWVASHRLVEGENEGQRRGKSAKDTNRPTYQKMLQLAKARLVDVIVVTRIDRISRSVVDFLLLVKELNQYGVKVVSLHENIDMTTPTGRFQTVLMIALAEHEREMISARVKEKVLWRAERGLPIGPPPSGYVMKDKMYAIDEAYAMHVREMDALYLEKESADAVVLEFRRKGYRTPKGAIYTVPIVCRMLRNPTYAAKIEYEGNVYGAQWQPIRPEKTHELIQKTMDRNCRQNGSRKRQSREYIYLLQGLIRCGHCRHMLSPQPGTSSNGRRHPYYSCGTAEKTRGTACSFRYVPAEAADRAVLEFLKKLHVKPEMVEEFARRANEFTSGTVSKLSTDLERVREQLGTVRTKIAHIVEAIAEGGKTVMASLKDKLQALETEREELESSEAKLRSEFEAEQTQEIAVQDQVQTLALFDRLVRENEGQPERLKSLLPRFVNYVLWHAKDKGEGEIEVGLFPNPVTLAPEVTCVGIDGRGEIRTGGLLVHPRVTDGMPDRT